MKLKRTHTIKALLLIYVGFSAAVCIALPSHLSDAGDDSDAVSITSAPLDLPQDIQQRIEENLGSGDDTPQTAAWPKPEETLPQATEDTDTETETSQEPETLPETDPESETDTTPETNPEPETDTTPETNPETEANTPSETDPEPETNATPENTAYISTKHAGASVNLRAAANSDSKIVANLYDKDEVIVLSTSGKWYEIQAGDATGYIYQDYLVFADE